MRGPKVTGRDWAVLVCVVGCLAGLVPVVHFTPGYWGVSTMSSTVSPTTVIEVTPGTPAARDGFQVNDVFLSGEDSPTVTYRLARLRPGEMIRMPVSRAGQKETAIEVTGVPSELAAFWYPTSWYPVGGLAFFLLGVFLYVTRPFQPAPIWLGVVSFVAGTVLAGGLTLAATIDTRSPLILWQRGPFDPLGHDGNGWQIALAIGAGLVLSLSGVVSMRDAVGRRVSASVKGLMPD